MNEKKANIERISRVVLLILLDVIFCFIAFALATWFLHSAVENGYAFPFKAASKPNGPLIDYYTLTQIAVFCALYIISFSFFRLYSSIWSVSGLNEGIMIIAGVGVGAAACILVNYLFSKVPFLAQFGFHNKSRIGICLASMFIIALVFCSRFGYRILRRLVIDAENGASDSDMKPTLIVGAGYFGAYVHSQITERHADKGCYTAAFVDDNKAKLGMRID